jgi:hypothetical protein
VGKLGKVLQVEFLNTYVSKIVGPCVRMLVGNIENLPQKIVILAETPQDNLKHKLLFNGMLNQYNRCKIHGYLVKTCLLKKLSRKISKENLPS